MSVMQENCEVFMELTMFEDTFSKWSIQSKITIDTVQAWTPFDDEDSFVTLKWPSDAITRKQFFDAISFYLNSNDDMYPFCGICCNIKSDHSSSWLIIKDKQITGTTNINSDAISETLTKKIKSAWEILSLRTPCQ